MSNPATEVTTDVSTLLRATVFVIEGTVANVYEETLMVVASSLRTGLFELELEKSQVQDLVLSEQTKLFY